MSQTNPGRDTARHEGARSAWAGVLWAALAVIGVAILAFGLGRWTAPEKRAAEGGAAADGQAAAETSQAATVWTCSMHPQIRLPKPGQCPICFMDLVRVSTDEGADAGPAQIALSERARKLAQVETTRVETRELTHEVGMVGKVAADETRITNVSSYIPGRIDRLFINYTGIFVRKGDHLAEIYSPELIVAQREYLTALESADKAGAAPEAFARQTADSLLRSARRKMELWGIPQDEIERLEKTRQPSDRMRVDAPNEGWVLEKLGYEGMYVETGTKLFTLADLRQVWVMLDAYELDLPYLHYAQTVEFEAEAFAGEKFTGRISYIDPTLSEMTRTVKVRVSVDNGAMRLRPGMFVRATLRAAVGGGGRVIEPSLAGKWISPMHPEIIKDAPGQCDVCGMDLVPAESLGFAGAQERPAKVLAIPETAVLRTGRRAVVYVEKEGAGRVLYEGREVDLGPRAGGYYVVEAGLKEGERVVTRGALAVDSALQIHAKQSMMSVQEDAEAAVAPDRLRHEGAREEPTGQHGNEATRRNARPVVKAYLRLVDALAADEGAKAVKLVEEIGSAAADARAEGLEGAAAGEFQKHMERIRAALPKKASDESGATPGIGIDAIRDRLGELTRAVSMYLRTFGHDLDQPISRMFCPMAFDNRGAEWLQSDEQVRNPYFGASMLRCGDKRGVIHTDGREQ